MGAPGNAYRYTVWILTKQGEWGGDREPWRVDGRELEYSCPEHSKERKIRSYTEERAEPKPVPEAWPAVSSSVEGTISGALGFMLRVVRRAE